MIKAGGFFMMIETEIVKFLYVVRDLSGQLVSVVDLGTEVVLESSPVPFKVVMAVSKCDCGIYDLKTGPAHKMTCGLFKGICGNN